MSKKREELEERIDRYLEGSLDPGQTVQFERDLLDPEVAQAFGKELMLRELLATTPDAEPSSHLAAEIEDALQVAAHKKTELEKETSDAEPSTGRFSSIKNVLSGLSWSVKGPAMAVQAAGSGAQPTRRAATGLSSMRYALSPLKEQAARLRPKRKQKTEPEPKRTKRRTRKPLWRRALKRLIKR